MDDIKVIALTAFITFIVTIVMIANSLSDNWCHVNQGDLTTEWKGRSYKLVELVK